MGLGTAVAFLTLDATGFARGIDYAVADARKLNTGFNNVSNTATKAGQTLTGVGKVLTAGITAPIVGFGVASVKSGADFDKSMSDVKAVSMATKTDMDKLNGAAKDLGVSYKKGSSDGETAFNALRATAIKMGNDTKFTAKESADALYYMGLAGWSADEMISGIPGVLHLASAGNTELATTSDIVTDAITGFGHQANETAKIVRGGFNKEIPIATRLADIMASAMANSNTDVDMLGESFKYVSPVAGSFGYSMEDVSLSLGLMANAGVKASQAGTTLRQGLKRLVAPADKAQAVMNKYGWSAADAHGKIKPLRQQMEELRGIFGNLDIEVVKSDGTLKTSKEIMQEYGRRLPVTQQEKLTDAVQLFGTTALPGMLAIMNASQDSFDDLAKSIDNSSASFVLHNGKVMTYKDAIKQYGEEVVTTSKSFEVLGAAEGMSLIQLDNLQGDWTLFKSALGTTKQIVSDLANGALRDFVQRLTDLVRKFNEMEPEQQKHILKLVAMAAAVGPLLVVFGRLVSLFGKVQMAMKAVAGLMNPVSSALSLVATKAVNLGEGFKLAKAGFPGLGKEASLLGSKLGTMSFAFTEASTAAGGGFVGAIKGAGAAIGAFFTPVTLIVAVIALLVAAFVHLMRTNEEFRNKVVGKFKDLASKLKKYLDKIVKAVNSMGFHFKDIAEVIAAAWDGLSKLLAPILQGIVTTITTVIDSIAQHITAVVEIITGIIGLIKGIVTGDGEQVKKSLKVLLDGVVDMFQSTFKFILTPVFALFDVINNIFGTKLPTTFDDFVSVVGKAFGFVVAHVKKFVDDIRFKAFQIKHKFVMTVTKAFSDLPKKIKKACDDTITNVKVWVSNMVQKSKEVGKKFLDNVSKPFRKLSEKIATFINDVKGKISAWVTFMIERAKFVGGRFVHNIILFFKQLPTKISTFINKVKGKISAWVTFMVERAKFVGGRFVHNVILFMKQLPTKVRTLLSKTIAKVTKFVTDIGKKGQAAGKSLVKNFKKAAMALISTVSSIGKNIVKGVWKGITSMADWFSGKVKGFFGNMVNSVKKSLGIHSPSRVFEKQVGLNIVLGVAKGITNNAKKAIDAAGMLVSNVLSTTQKVYDKQYASISASIAKTSKMVEDAEKKLTKKLGTEQTKRIKAHLVSLSKKLKNQKQALKDLQNVYLQYCEDQLNDEMQLYDYSNKQIVEYWKKVRSHLKKGTDAYKRASEQIKQARVKMYAEMITEAEANLEKMKEQREVSLAEEAKYWEGVRKHCLAGSKAYNEATKKINDANKQLADSADEAFKTLGDGLANVIQDTNEKIQGVIKEYNDTIQSTKDTLMGLAGLFEEFTQDEAVSGEDLYNNLQTQVDGLSNWNATVDKLFSSSLPKDLIDELVAMGPKAAGSINNLLSMTDEQLSKYVELWEKKNKEAQDAALKVVDKDKYAEQIKTYIDEAGKQVDVLLKDYNDAMAKIGLTSIKAGKDASSNFTKTFKNALKTNLANSDFSFIADTLANQKFSKLGKTVANPVSKSVVDGLKDGITKAVKTVSDMPLATSILQNAISADVDMVDTSGYKQVGNEAIDNVVSGANTNSPKLNSAMNTIGAKSQNSLIGGVKSKESAVNSEGFNIGMQLDMGIVRGINAYVGSIISAAVAAVEAAVAAARAAADIHSPSRVFERQVGKWMPLGIAQGFVKHMPEATNEMQKSIDSGINSLNANMDGVFPNVKNIGEQVKDAFKDVSEWFGEVAKNVDSVTENMKENLKDAVDVTKGMLNNVYDGENNALNVLISGKNTETEQNGKKGSDVNGVNNNTTNNNNTFIFNSPKPINEVQASRLLKQTTRDLAEGFE